MEIRVYDHSRDFAAVARIWREIGWVEKGNDRQEAGLKAFAEQYTGLVAEIDGEAECYVATGEGTVRYLTEDLPMSGVTAVATSHIVRRQGLARRLTALALAREARSGAAVSALGMFDQGYYNRLGFGTGPYEYWHSFDPAGLRVSAKARQPRRLTKDDWDVVHRSRLNRYRGHGSCNLAAPAATQAEMAWEGNGFGLGYADGADGELTHHMWLNAKSMETGPLEVWWMAYQTPDQFLELMALLVHLGDQVQLVTMREPAIVQLQDFIDKPFRSQRMTRKSDYENRVRAAAYWQMRILDLDTCIPATRLDGELRFNLELTDPIEQELEPDAPWRGISGSYVISLGPESTVTRGSAPDLPTMQAGVGPFTRMWLGVRPASGLAITDNLSGPPELLADLDRVLRLPVPKPDWDF